MLEQNLHADEDENDTAGQLCAALVARAEEIADPNAHEREHKGRAADERDGGRDVHAEEGERDADSQRVDARGDRQREELAIANAPTVLGLLFLLLAALADHIAADEGEQHKGDPMIPALDVAREPAAEQIARERHERLKAAEEQRQQQRVALVDPLHAEALADGHGKSVHRKTDADQEQFKKSHGLSSAHKKIRYVAAPENKTQVRQNHT